jgi:hypothetical protein
VVVPSLPGYGFSEAPKTDGSGSVRNMAVILHKLMVEELGYKKYSKSTPFLIKNALYINYYVL